MQNKSNHLVKSSSSARTFKQRSLEPVTAQLTVLPVSAASPTASEMTADWFPPCNFPTGRNLRIAKILVTLTVIFISSQQW